MMPGDIDSDVNQIGDNLVSQHQHKMALIFTMDLHFIFIFNLYFYYKIISEIYIHLDIFRKNRELNSKLIQDLRQYL